MPLNFKNVKTKKSIKQNKTKMKNEMRKIEQKFEVL